MLDSCGFVDRFCSSATSDISHRQDFTRSLPVTVAADPTRRIQELQIKVQTAIQLHNSIGRLVRKQYRPAMLCQQLSRPHLIIP
jgi:hypothetical protein